MRARLFLLLGTVALPLVVHGQTPDDPFAEKPVPVVKRGVMPEIKLARSLPASPEEEARIKQHIANLAKIASPDFGLSGTMGGMAFAPVLGSGVSTGGSLLTDHKLQTADDFRRLVEFGPKAMPFLLAALDDATPTKLTIGGPEAIFTVMELSTEFDGNALNPVEQAAVAALPKHEWDGTSLKSYTVKLGDVCFVIIGQIVGRAYLAVRYQPTAIVIINSPVEKKELAKAVRDVWSGPDASQRLFESLRGDYSTEGIFNGKSLDGWDLGNVLQCQAAMRMLYYFPQETSHPIAARLARLDVRQVREDLDSSMKRCVANGVRSEDFLRAVAWSADSAIRKEVLAIFKRTNDVDVFVTALGAIDAVDKALVEQRIATLVNQLPPEESGPFGDGFKLLWLAGEKLGVESRSIFERYLKDASLQRWGTMARVLMETQKVWAVELLSPALDDKRDTGYTYSVVPDQNEPRQAVRVCDGAAHTISSSRPDLPFKLEGDRDNLDRQIGAMQKRIAEARK